MGDYPDTEELFALGASVESPQDFVEHVNRVWWHDGFRVHGPDPDDWGEKFYVCQLSTWGWSGNEERMETIKRHWFWFFWWEQSRRGGHYTFKVPESMWRAPMPEPLKVGA